jgi:hypothetical protein
MSLIIVILLSSTLFADPQNAQTGRDTECATWQDCRRLALEAADRQDYDAFHDLAWRTAQKGPKNNPELMTLVARAQSLSGRPHDALVMLQRLLAMGVVTDAATSDDFRRVRALPAWSDFERDVADAGEKRNAPDAAKPDAAKAGKPDPAGARPTTARPENPAESRTSPKPEAAPKPGSAAKPDTARTAEPPGAEAVVGDADEAIRFNTPAFTPAGLAYDEVSDRFIVGDEHARKLTVVDEASRRVANLVGAQSAGFGDIGGLEIDAHEGDLWVVSTTSEDPAVARLHKLQLVSARILYSIELPASFGAARFSDVAVAPHGTVIALDSLGNRLFSVTPKSRDPKLGAKLDVKNATSVAPESASTAYVAHEKGIVQVDLGSRRSRAVKASKNVDLAGLHRIRWHHGSLVATQKATDGSYRIVRIQLSGDGRTATSLEVLDRGVPMTSPKAAALSGDIFYYLASSANDEAIIRRVTIK